MKRVDKTGAPFMLGGAEELMKSWEPSGEPLMKAKPHGTKSLKPPKAWWNEKYAEIKRGNPAYSEEQIKATVGSIWYKEMSGKQKSTRRKDEGKKYGKAPVKKSEEMSKADLYKACVAKAKADGRKDPEGFCHLEIQKMEKTEKAEAKLKDASQQDRETFRGAPRQEGKNILEAVKRNAREKIKEKMGQLKEDAALTKKKKMTKAEAGMSYKQMKKMEDKYKNLPLEEAKNLTQSPNWKSKEILSIVHPEKRSEVLSVLREKK